MKIIIPLAGIGSRLKPHTFSTPKPLMEVAGRAIIDYIMDGVKTLNPDEIVFVVGYKKEVVEEYIKEHYPQFNSSFVYQKVRDGDGSAIRLALETFQTDDEVYIVFGADTLIDFNLKKSIDKCKGCDGMVFAMKVENPSNYGVVVYDDNLEIVEVEEKPENPKSDLAIIGAYYFKSAYEIKKHLQYFYENKITEKGEYRIIQVIREFVKDSKKIMKVEEVTKWFDCGRIEVLLEANKYFLTKKSNGKSIKKNNSIIIPPSYIHKNAIIDNCVIGPFASIGAEASLKNVIISNSIIGKKTIMENIVLKNSTVGKEALLKYRQKEINLGEKSGIIFD